MPKSHQNIYKEIERKNNYHVTAAFMHNRNKVLSLATSFFDWINLPPEIDKRFIEISLITYGKLCFFYDKELEMHMVLPFSTISKYDIYNNPIRVHVFANNGYNRNIDVTDCVLIYDNTIRFPLITDVYYYANRLTEIDKSYNVNLDNQKTPLFIMCDESQRLSMMNAFIQVDNGLPVIFATKDFDPDSIKAVNIKPEFICDKLFAEKGNLYNEILSTFGVNSVAYEKKERLTNQEISASNAHNYLYRYSRFEPREQAVKQINDMFGLNIEVRENFYQGVEKIEQIYDDSSGNL